MVEGGYFDGRTSRRRPVRLRVGPSGLEVRGEEVSRIELPGSVRVSEPIGAAPRTLTFADGAYCEVAQGDALAELLGALGHRDGVVARWQASWKIAFVALIAVTVALAAAYRWGLPWLAAQTAPRLPQAFVATLSDEVMQLLDKRALAASSLPASRRQEIEQGFRRLTASDPDLADYRLLFRRGAAIGPNAFALPDGRIVLLDELVALASGDGEVLAVLAHELGHAKYRHGLRQLIQSSVVAAMVASYFGDVSTLLSGLGTLLLESKYSRGFELEADHYGASLLRASGGSPQDLAAMLEKLEKAHATRHGNPLPNGVGDWLSSHPETAERIRRLQGAP